VIFSPRRSRAGVAPDRAGAAKDPRGEKARVHLVCSDIVREMFFFVLVK
jgi:hypothetical protein